MALGTPARGHRVAIRRVPCRRGPLRTASATAAATSAVGSPRPPTIFMFSETTRSFDRFLARLLVFPCIQLQASLDQHLASLGEIFAGDLGLPAPKGHVDESRLVAA